MLRMRRWRREFSSRICLLVMDGMELQRMNDLRCYECQAANFSLFVGEEAPLSGVSFFVGEEVVLLVFSLFSAEEAPLLGFSLFAGDVEPLLGFSREGGGEALTSSLRFYTSTIAKAMTSMLDTGDMPTSGERYSPFSSRFSSLRKYASPSLPTRIFCSTRLSFTRSVTMRFPEARDMI